MGHGAIQRCTTGTNPYESWGCTTMHGPHGSWGCTMLYNDPPSPWVMGLYNVVQRLTPSMGHGVVQCCTTVHCQSHSTLRLPMCYERQLALSNPCWTLPVGCSLVHRGRIGSTINLYPAKGKVMAMSAATTSLEWPD